MVYDAQLVHGELSGNSPGRETDIQERYVQILICVEVTICTTLVKRERKTYKQRDIVRQLSTELSQPS